MNLTNNLLGVDPSANPPSWVLQYGNDGWLDKGWNIAFHIGSMPVAWYGVGYLIAFVVCITLTCLKLWKVYKLNIDVFYWFCIICIPAAILGGRTWSFVIGDAKVGQNGFFDFKSGGMAIEGGVMFALISAMIYFPLILKRPKYQKRVLDLKTNKYEVKQVSSFLYIDAVCGTVPLGQFIGRWGNYANQELYGAPVTDNGFQIWMRDHLPGMYIDGEWRQPLFLWEGIANLGFFLFIFIGFEFIKNKNFRRAGDITILYFIWYGILRLCLEPLRDHQYTFAGSYIISGVWVGAGVVLYALNHTLLIKLRNYRVFWYIKHWFYYRKETLVNMWKIHRSKVKDNKKALDVNLEKSKYIKNRFFEIRKQFIRKPEDMLYYMNL